MKITVIGTGYVGLVAGVCLAELGNDVICVDVNEEKIKNLNQKIVPIYERGLKEMLVRNVDVGRINFTTDIKESIETSEVIFIAVGTPPGEDHRVDLKYVYAVAKDIGRYMKTLVLSRLRCGEKYRNSSKIRKITSAPYY